MYPCFLFLLPVLILCCPVPCAFAAPPLIWPDLRDGVVYLRMQAGETARLGVKDVWAAEGTRDRLYFQAPDGEMLDRFLLSAGKKPADITLLAKRGAGDYRFEVCGLSHRATTLRVDPATPTVFEPAKVHFSLTSPGKGAKLYFRVPADNRAFSFRARTFRGSCKAYELLSPSGKRYELKPKELHSSVKEHAGLDFSGDRHESGVWTLLFRDSGKAAFWLDGIPNLFAQKPEHLFMPEFKPAKAEVRLTGRVLGETPLLGVALDAYPLAPAYEEALRQLSPETVHYYFFPELADRPGHTQRARLAPFPCREEYILFSTLNSRAMIAEEHARQGLRDLRQSRKTGQEPLTAVSFVDEPNLRFGKTAYLKRFAALRAVQDAGAPEFPLMVPDSSMLTEGPLVDDNADRKGLDWMEALYQQGLMPKAPRPFLAWHEWMYRDLLATEAFRDAVNEAARFAVGKSPAPLLVINQTNISSGSDTSVYDQDSFFASLWLGAAFAHAAGTGQLHAFGWFMMTDDIETHHKGLFALRGEARNLQEIQLKERPVLQVFRLLLAHKLPLVLELQGGHPDLAMFACADQARKQLALFVTNTAPRRITLNLKAEEAVLQHQKAVLLTLQEGDASPKRQSLSALTNLDLKPQSVNILLLGRQDRQGK